MAIRLAGVELSARSKMRFLQLKLLFLRPLFLANAAGVKEFVSENENEAKTSHLKSADP